MNPRVEYKMTEEDLKVLLKACKSVPVMMVGSQSLGSTQENSNRAWESLGDKMGFEVMTVLPSGKGQKFFKRLFFLFR